MNRYTTIPASLGGDWTVEVVGRLHDSMRRHFSEPDLIESEQALHVHIVGNIDQLAGLVTASKAISQVQAVLSQNPGPNSMMRDRQTGTCAFEGIAAGRRSDRM